MSKIKIPRIKIPYKFYKVFWIDTNSNANWESLEQIKKNTPSLCVTTGWLVSKENNCHTFISDFGISEDGEIDDGGNSTTIPSVNIIKLKQIRIK